MELRLESLCEEEVVKPIEETYDNNDIKEEDKNVFRYFTREACILPLNERTLKKRMDKEAEEEMKKLQMENEKKAEIEQKLKLMELNEKKKRQKEEEESKKKRQEKKLQEEQEEIEKLVNSKERQLRSTTGSVLRIILKDFILFGVGRIQKRPDPADFQVP